MGISSKTKPAPILEWERLSGGGERILVVFLRHLGCTFCMEALSDLREQLTQIEDKNARVVVVHMSDTEFGKIKLERYGLSGVKQISDPKRELYKYFDLKLGTPLQLFGPKVWARGVEAFLQGGHLIGKLSGNGFQMPGVVLCEEGECSLVYRHPHAGSRPDYANLCENQTL